MRSFSRSTWISFDIFTKVRTSELVASEHSSDFYIIDWQTHRCSCTPSDFSLLSASSPRMGFSSLKRIAVEMRARLGVEVYSLEAILRKI